MQFESIWDAIFYFKKSILLISQAVFWGTMIWTYRKSSSNQQITDSPHPRWPKCRLPHRSRWKCWRKGSPWVELASRLHGFSFTRFHPMPPKRFAKVIAPGIFKQQPKHGRWTSELLVTFWASSKGVQLRIFNACHVRKSSGGSASSCACSISGRITLGEPNFLCKRSMKNLAIKTSTLKLQPASLKSKRHF